MVKKILFVSYDGYNTTNSRVRSYRFCNELKKRGIDAATFSFKDDLHARYDGPQSHKSGFFERLSLLIRAFFRLMQEKKDTTFYIQKAGYFALAPYAVHLLKGNRYILDYDDYEYEQSRISRWLLRTLAKRAVFCVAASRYLQRFLSAFNRKAYYLPTGVDQNIFRPAKARKPHKNKEVIFSWVGFIVDDIALENVMFLLDCFDELTKKNPAARLEIVGGGWYIDKLTARLGELGNKNISYLGVISPDKIPKYLSGVDVGLFALVNDTKYNKSKSPTKLFEYMAMGLPVIATAVGESGHVIADGKDGLIARNRKEFIKQAEKLIKKRELRERLGKAALSKISRQYNLDTLGKELHNIILAELG